MTLSLLVTSLFLAFGVSECIAHIPQGGIAEELSGFSQKQEDSQEDTMVSAEEDGFANVEEGSGESELEASSESVVGPFKTHCVEEGPSSSTHFRYNHCCAPIDRWYFECKPGYFFFTDEDMRHFFHKGGFSFRGEMGYRFCEYFMVWFDGGYFQKEGSAIGGAESLRIRLATLSLGIKGIYDFNDYFSLYVGAGPRIFLMLLHNDSPFVRSDDNEVGIGGGFDAGFWIYPIPSWENFFLDIFADYSLKKLGISEDEVSSLDNDVDVSGLTVGLGLGFHF
ncbi:MAG: hypothetical protein ACD_17C00419G0002 [uncultured bacterium]|nr:MAG: hypothetical protein ACD_17C00419G0002 [uncultured bacterium]